MQPDDAQRRNDIVFRNVNLELMSLHRCFCLPDRWLGYSGQCQHKLRSQTNRFSVPLGEILQVRKSFVDDAHGAKECSDCTMRKIWICRDGRYIEEPRLSVDSTREGRKSGGETI